jgi:hypothetical protein
VVRLKDAAPGATAATAADDEHLAQAS